VVLRFISFALTLLLFTPGSMLSVWASDAAGGRAAKPAQVRVHAPRQAQGAARDAARGGRAAGPQRQALERARRCHESVANAQQSANNLAMGSMALSQAAAFIPFGGSVASSVAGAAMGAGAMVAGEAARQKLANAANGC
jgi:hypothetical protein